MKRPSNNNAYYPCNVCGWNSPLNTVRSDANGKETALCPIHLINENDDKEGEAYEKKREAFKDEIRKGLFNIDKTSIEDITV